MTRDIAGHVRLLEQGLPEQTTDHGVTPDGVLVVLVSGKYERVELGDE